VANQKSKHQNCGFIYIELPRPLGRGGW